MQHVVQMDPDYAPAWAELGIRAYYDATYSDGGETMYQLSNQACAQGGDARSESHTRRRAS